MQLILQVVSAAAEDLNRIDASRLILWVDAGQTLTVGRSGTRADFAVFEDARMSSAHFSVSCEPDGCHVRDLKSTNGTLVNGTRVTEARLHDGDMILAGETVFDVRIKGEAALNPNPLDSVQALEASVAPPDSMATAQPPPSDHQLASSVTTPPTAPAPPHEPASSAAVLAAIKILSGPFSKSEAANLTRLILWLRPGEVLSFGRTDRSDVAIRQDERMTSLHFEMECDGEICTVRDMGSRNGTYLNEHRIEEAQVEDGDTVRAGTTSFQIGLVECDAAGRPVTPLESDEDAPGLDAIASNVSTPSQDLAAADEQMRVVLAIADPDPASREQRGMSWFGAGQSITVGRASDRADLVVSEDQAMSGAHFEVSCDGHRCRLRDLDSRNGTMVNGQAVSEVVICNGDQILAGRTRFSVTVVGGAMSEQTLDFAPAVADRAPAEREAPKQITLPDLDAILADIAVGTAPSETTAGEDPQSIIDELVPSAEAVRERVQAGKAIEGAVLNGLDLSNADLQGAQLLRCTLTDVNLEGANLRAANLKDSVLVRVKLTKADLSRADLTDTIWSETVACQAKLSKATLNGTIMLPDKRPVYTEEEVELSFDSAQVPPLLLPKLTEEGVCGFAWQGCDLSGADLKGCHLQGARWERVTLKDAHLANANLDDTRWQFCDVSSATFKRTRLQEVQLEACKLDEVDLSTSYLRRVHFHHTDLSDSPVLPRMLPGCGFVDCQLGGRDLSFCNLREAEFTRVNLEQIELIDSQLRGASFQECDLTGVRLVGVDLTDANFENSALDQADLTDSNLTAVNLSHVSLQSARLSRALLKDTLLMDADLSGATLVDTILDHATLTGANLERADLRGAKFDSADLTGIDFSTTELGHTDFTSCLLKASSFQGMDLARCKFHGCNLVEANLAQASLRRVDCQQSNFTQANLTKANLEEANCQAGKFAKAQAGGANFTKARLEGANFDGACLPKAIFAHAVLDQAILTTADCTAADFHSASLRFADLSQAVLEEADFQQADVLQANLHRVDDPASRWSGANRHQARETDTARASAEAWQPPSPPEPLMPISSAKGS